MMVCEPTTWSIQIGICLAGGEWSYFSRKSMLRVLLIPYKSYWKMLALNCEIKLSSKNDSRNDSCNFDFGRMGTTWIQCVMVLGNFITCQKFGESRQGSAVRIHNDFQFGYHLHYTFEFTDLESTWIFVRIRISKSIIYFTSDQCSYIFLNHTIINRIYNHV